MTGGASGVEPAGVALANAASTSGAAATPSCTRNSSMMPLKENATGATILTSWLRPSGVWLRPTQASTAGAKAGRPVAALDPTSLPLQYSLTPVAGSKVATRWFHA